MPEQVTTPELTCHECGAPVPATAKRCFVFNHLFCDPCWNRLLPPDPVEYNEFFARDGRTYGPGWPD